MKHFRIVLHDGQELANSNALIETTADLLDERITRQLVATVHNRQQDTRVWATELLQPCPMSEDLAFTCNCGEISTADLACCPKCGCTTVLERDPPDEWELDRASVQLGEVRTYTGRKHSTGNVTPALCGTLPLLQYGAHYLERSRLTFAGVGCRQLWGCRPRPP